MPFKFFKASEKSYDISTLRVIGSKTPGNKINSLPFSGLPSFSVWWPPCRRKIWISSKTIFPLDWRERLVKQNWTRRWMSSKAEKFRPDWTDIPKAILILTTLWNDLLWPECRSTHAFWRVSSFANESSSRLRNATWKRHPIAHTYEEMRTIVFFIARNTNLQHYKVKCSRFSDDIFDRLPDCILRAT